MFIGVFLLNFGFNTYPEVVLESFIFCIPKYQMLTKVRADCFIFSLQHFIVTDFFPHRDVACVCLLVQEKKTPIFKFIFSSEEKTQGTDSVPSDDAAGFVCMGLFSVL